MATAFVRIEKYVLPLLYAYLAWKQFEFLRGEPVVHAALNGTFSLPMVRNDLHFYDVIRHLMILALMTFTGGTLLLSRTPAVLPDRLQHVLVPFAMSYYWVLFGVYSTLPPLLQRNWLFPQWRFSFALAGIGFSILGYCLSVWAIAYLGRAFGLLVSVKTVVLRGPYAYVRHPIYLGYLLDSIGLLLVTCSIGILIYISGFIVLMIHRARLEEDKLDQASAEYKQHRQKTGFLFPRRSRDTGQAS